MAKVYRTQVLGPGSLDWVIELNGAPVDVDTITYEIEDITTGVPVPVIGPATPGHSATGTYYAIWTVPDTQNIGTHRVIWKWKLTPTSVQQQGPEEFEVLTTIGGPGDNLYLSLADLYADGLPRGKYDEAFLLERMQFVQDYIELITRTFFNQREMTLRFDGSGNELLRLPYPLLQVDEIAFELNQGTFEVQPLSYFETYLQYEDRQYPRIRINRDFSDTVFNIVILGMFPPGTQNIRIAGKWGYLDRNGNTPTPILMANKMLLKRYLKQTMSPVAKGNRVGVKSQNTDGHSYTLHDAMVVGSLTGYPDIDSILTFYAQQGSASVISRSF